LVQLLVATARNLEMKSTAAAFTGPWARGDVGTIRLHRGHLKDKQILKLYDALRLARIELPNGA
jgi:predicted short-subunit dehydrogenase-like oxidoreductase (DUF2520 family)